MFDDASEYVQNVLSSPQGAVVDRYFHRIPVERQLLKRSLWIVVAADFATPNANDAWSLEGRIDFFLNKAIASRLYFARGNTDFTLGAVSKKILVANEVDGGDSQPTMSIPGLSAASTFITRIAPYGFYEECDEIGFFVNKINWISGVGPGTNISITTGLRCLSSRL